ncbi:uncharacterized protein LOC123910908 [Trifolium pratense]|uniref:uncharacterized protein LOC123910908 n=1 Tax=Trifolium pratense TaxID=57577 RepID=UPI001E696477|nr:uncharacterized protein LOC123910908 [Trifolium pratense]
MSDVSVKGSSCLAITEKNNNQKQDGSCVGIFFQLFDWNKTLTKKRFFTKKLLPPVNAKQDSLKRFKSDEKMPNSKLHLIANGNNVGFTNAEKGENCVIEVEQQKHEMKVPSLVARLMGLESIPASKRDKSEKSSFSDSDDGEESFEIGDANARHDSRPQKLRKTEANERRAVTRFGTEALQIKSVLSQVRKYNPHHHHHTNKLVSPLKSPRISSGKSGSRSSRLIEAATKILEPGLQPTSRSKSSLKSSISTFPPNNGIAIERVGARLQDIHKQSCYHAGIDKSMVEHTCKTCGNLLDVEISRPVDSDVFTDFSSALTQNGRLFSPSHENDVVLLRSQEKIITLVDEDVKKNAYSCNESTTIRIPVPEKWNLSRQLHGGLEDDGTSSFAFRHKTQTQERVLSGDKMLFEFGSRTSNMQEKRVSTAATASTANGNKDSVGLNRSLSGRNRTRSPTKLGSCDHERKRRTLNVSKVDNTASVNSVTSKQRNVSFDAQRGKRRSFDAFSPNNSNDKSKRESYQKTDKINRVVSSTLSLPLKKKEETRSDYQIKTCFQRHHPPLREDVIGAFLEQKLKELRSRENKELVNGDRPKRSSALILQELISVLNVERLICTDDHRMFNDKDHMYETKHVRLFGTSCNGNHLSPGSVLEASFSSSSLEENSGHCFHPDSINCSYDQPERLEQEAGLLNSETSFNIGKIGYKILTELVNRIHSILHSLDSFWTRLTKSKLNHMKDVIFNAELILGNVTRHSEVEVLPQLLISCILDELDNIATNTMLRNFNQSEIKGFLFDCVIEYLESNCFQHYYSVFKSWCAWTKVPLCIKSEVVVQGVKSEIKKWEFLAGMEPDQIIEWEMSHSLGKWTGFNIEAFEFGVDIGEDVLQILLDEIVEDHVNFRKVTV